MSINTFGSIFVLLFANTLLPFRHPPQPPNNDRRGGDRGGQGQGFQGGTYQPQYTGGYAQAAQAAGYNAQPGGYDYAAAGQYNYGSAQPQAAYGGAPAQSYDQGYGGY